MKEESYPPLNCKEGKRSLILVVLHRSSGFISSPKKHLGCAALLNLSLCKSALQSMCWAKYQAVLNTPEVKTQLYKAKKINAIHKTALARNLENLNTHIIFFLNQCLIFENHYCSCLYPVCKRTDRKKNLL